MITREEGEDTEMSAIIFLQAVLPVVSQVVCIYLAWLKIREYHRRDQDE